MSIWASALLFLIAMLLEPTTSNTEMLRAPRMSAKRAAPAALIDRVSGGLGPKAIMISASSISLHQRHINLRLRVSRWFCR